MSGPVSQTTSHKTAKKQCSMEKLRALVVPGLSYQPHLPARLRVHLQHRYRRTRQKTCCMIPQKLKTLMQHWEVGRMICQNAWRNSLKIKWTTKLRHQAMHPQALLVNHIFTHFSKDRNCEVCKRTKTTRAPCRRRIGGAVPRAEFFGDLITTDHKIM